MSESHRIDQPDEVRRARLHDLQSRGINPFPNDFKPSNTIASMADHLRAWKERILQHSGDAAWQAEREAFNTCAVEPRSVSMAGRVVARRIFGKAIFLDLQDRSGRIQVLLSQKELTREDSGQPFEFFREDLDIGDFLGIKGLLFWTRTGELTLQARTARLVAKSLRQLPEKWHGLQDQETRYRQRYVDLIATPESRTIFLKRSATVRAVRRFLEARDYLEVETPMLQPLAGGAAARPFVTHHNALDMALYLRIAPELYLKRLVVGGFERVFEINRNFRNEGLSRRHNPEFTMLEFYQAYSTFEDLMDLTEEMLEQVALEVNGTSDLAIEERPLSLARPWRRLSLRESLVELGGLSQVEVGDSAALRARLEGTDALVRGNESLGHLQTLVFEERVEHLLWNPTFIFGYPVEVSPLARRNDKDPSVTDRFELFVAGRELANAFSELNDPEDQRERFVAQLAAREAGDDEAHGYDADYIRALQYGMPPAAGEGIGIDRLVMLLTGAPSIRDVILFPQMRPESA